MTAVSITARAESVYLERFPKDFLKAGLILADK